MCMCMTTKTISIMEDVYELLARRKRAHESFSELLRRTIRKPDILESAGAWKHIPDEEIEEMKANIRKRRRLTTEARRRRE